MRLSNGVVKTFTGGTALKLVPPYDLRLQFDFFHSLGNFVAELMGALFVAFDGAADGIANVGAVAAELVGLDDHRHLGAHRRLRPGRGGDHRAVGAGDRHPVAVDGDDPAFEEVVAADVECRGYSDDTGGIVCEVSDRVLFRSG